MCRSTRSMLLFDGSIFNSWSTVPVKSGLSLGLNKGYEKLHWEDITTKNRHYRQPFIMLIWLPPVVSERLHVPALSKLKTQNDQNTYPIGLILSNKTSWRSSQWAYLLFIEYTPPLNRAVWVQLILFSAFTDSHWTSMPFKYPCHVQTG